MRIPAKNAQDGYPGTPQQATSVEVRTIVEVAL